MQHSKAIVICGHGSKNESGVKAFLDFFSKIKAAYPDFEIQYGFIEYSAPSLNEILDDIIMKGFAEIIIVPAILFTGVHIKYDIPYIINETRKKHNKIKIKLAGYLGINSNLISLCEKNIRVSLNKSGIKNINDTNLLLIGVGSSQKKANVDIAALTRHIWEKTGLHFGLYSFISQMTFPSIEETLEILESLPQNNIIILPYLLFPGSYLDKIHLKIENFKKISKKNVVITKTLENDELMVKAIQKRIDEVLSGEKDFATNIPQEIQPRISHKK